MSGEVEEWEEVDAHFWGWGGGPGALGFIGVGRRDREGFVAGFGLQVGEEGKAVLWGCEQGVIFVPWCRPCWKCVDSVLACWFVALRDMEK